METYFTLMLTKSARSTIPKIPKTKPTGEKPPTGATPPVTPELAALSAQATQELVLAVNAELLPSKASTIRSAITNLIINGAGNGVGEAANYELDSDALKGGKKFIPYSGVINFFSNLINGNPYEKDTELHAIFNAVQGARGLQTFITTGTGVLGATAPGLFSRGAEKYLTKAKTGIAEYNAAQRKPGSLLHTRKQLDKAKNSNAMAIKANLNAAERALQAGRVTGIIAPVVEMTTATLGDVTTNIAATEKIQSAKELSNIVAQANKLNAEAAAAQADATLKKEQAAEATANAKYLAAQEANIAETNAIQRENVLAQNNTATATGEGLAGLAKQVSDLVETLKGITEKLKSLMDAANKREKIKWALGLGAGAIVLGGAGYALYKWLQDREEERNSRTRMKMHLDTPDGKGAIVDLPINNPELSGKLEEEFNKGVTRSVRSTARHNSVKRDPETNKLMPYPEWKKKYPNGIGATGLDYVQKAAKLVNMPTTNLVDGYAELMNTPLPDQPRSSKVRNFLDSFELSKQASGRDTLAALLSEIFGSMSAPALAGLGAGLFANRKLGMDLPLSLIAGGATAMAAPLLGMAASSFISNRTLQEQAKHDTGYHGLLNAVIPGYAHFNLLQRANIITDPVQTLRLLNATILATTSESTDDDKPVVKNKNLTNDSVDFDDDDF